MKTRNRKAISKRQQSKPTARTFASLFPASGRYNTKSGKIGWRIRGSGVNGPCETAETTQAIVSFLEQAGIPVKRWGIGGFAAADMFTVSAKFLDGSLFGETGNYMFRAKGAWLVGVKAIAFVALGLDLRIRRNFLDEHFPAGVTLDELKREALQPASSSGS